MPADGKRKVRCPKCTAVLTEPQDEIYECPICSALLLAKGASGFSNLRSQGNEYSTGVRDVDYAQGKIEGKLGSEKVNPGTEPGNSQQKEDMAISKLKFFVDNSSRPFRSETLYDGTRTNIKLPREENVWVEPNRQEYARPQHNSSPKKGLMPKLNALFSRASGRETLRNSFKSEEGDRFSELSSASYTESDYEGDSPLRASVDQLEHKDVNVHSLVPKLSSAVGPTNGFVQKEGSFQQMDVPYSHESPVIDSRNRTNLVSTSRSDVEGVSVGVQGQGHHVYDNRSDNRSTQADNMAVSVRNKVLNEDNKGSTDDSDMSIPKNPGRRLFDLTVLGILNENAFNDIKRGQHTSTVTTNVIGEHQKHSPNTEDSVNWIQKPDVTNMPTRIEQNENVPEFSDQEIGAAKEIAASQEQNVKNRNLISNSQNGYSDGVPSVVGLNTQVLSDIDTDALVAARYGSALSEKDLSQDITVDVSFGDWKSSHDVPEQKRSINENRMMNLKEEDSDDWGEDDHASGKEKDVRNIKAMEESRSFQGSSPLTSRGNASPELSGGHLRTAAMQKLLLQRVDQENKTLRHVDTDEEMNIYEAPYDFNDTHRQNITKEESHGENGLIVTSNTDTLPSNHHYGLPDAVQSSTAKSLHFNEIHAFSMQPSTIMNVNNKEFNSEDSKYSYGPINRIDHVETEVTRKLSDFSIHQRPFQAKRRSTLQWKGKSTVTEFELRSSAEDMQSHGFDPVSIRNVGKDAHGPSVIVGRSQFDENGKHGSDLFPMRQNEAWNMSVDSENAPSQKSNVMHTDSGFSSLSSLRRLREHKKTEIGSGVNMEYNNKESRFRGQPREEYLGELHDTVNEMLHPLPLPLHGSSTSPNSLHNNLFNQNTHHCHSPSCTFCIQPQYNRQLSQQPHILHNTFIPPCATRASQAAARSYQPLHDDLSHNVEVLSHSSGSYKGTNTVPKSQRRNRSKLHNQAFTAVEQDKRIYPPLPDTSSAPYVFCNGCNQILEVPLYLPPNRGPIQKLKCGTCRKVSKFSIFLQESNGPSLVDEGSEPFEDSVSDRSFERISLEHRRREQLGSSLHTRKNGSQLQPHNYFQGNRNASSISDYESNPRTVGMLGQRQFRFGNSKSKAYSEGYNSSSPSSASGSSPQKHQMNHEKSAFGEEIQSAGLHAGSKMYEANKPYLEALLSDEFSHENSDMSRNNIAHARSQGHLVTAQRQRAASWQNQDVEVEFSRNSSTNNNSQMKGMSSGPINNNSQPVDPSLYQDHLHKDPSGDGSRSAPWSPAAESRTSSQKTKDNEREWQSLSPQNEPKGPKYFAELITKGLRDIGKGYRTGNKGKVIVNGHLIHEVAVRKAEEKAGTIHPGSYWYDYNAGFWGLMGGPCQGVVMSHIKEFDFPMEQSCAGGKTGILVNGRELHEKDLEVLAKRGLPKVPGVAYVMDMQGNVRNKATGQQLKGLGRLAPSIEKKGCGWGMFQSVGKH